MTLATTELTVESTRSIIQTVTGDAVEPRTLVRLTRLQNHLTRLQQLTPEQMLDAQN